MLKLAKTLVAALVGIAVGAMMSVAAAAELPVGTIIEKANIDKIKGDTFDGHKISDLLTEKIEWQIREWGLKITLDKAKPLPVEPRFVEATKKYSSQVKFDPATKDVTGYQAGLPFPNIVNSDPDAGYKLLWNFYYAPREGDALLNRYFSVAISADKGVDQVSEWIYDRYFAKGRLSGDKPVDGDGSIVNKTYVIAQSPEDIKGLGTFSIRYDSPKFEDTWAYLRSARRARRLSSTAWMDPIGGTDILQDDLDVFNARPSWYKSIKLVGKRWVLAISDSRQDIYQAKNKKSAARNGDPSAFPGIDIKNFPHWNPVQKWQPREVYVVEAIPPAEHPYSRRVVYLDATLMRPYFAENYDKKGEFWKWTNYALFPQVSESGQRTFTTNTNDYIDFKARHATIAVIFDQRVDPKGVTGDHWSLSNLEQLSK
jgi:hypothetical protein